MNGFIPKTLAGITISANMLLLNGCHYHDLVDPCWPERYNSIAKGSVREAFAAQAANGHVRDQTLWNYHFQKNADGTPTDTLNAAGIERLLYLSRRQPYPDLSLYLQTAQDIPFVSNEPEKLIRTRQELDQRRIQAIQGFMTTQLAPRGLNAAVDVVVYDPADVGIYAPNIAGSLPPSREIPVLGAHQKLQQNYQGLLPGSGAAGASGASR